MRGRRKYDIIYINNTTKISYIREGDSAMEILETLVSVLLVAIVPLALFEMFLTMSLRKGVDYYFDRLEKYEKRKAARPEKTE